MVAIVHTATASCQDCYKCVRECPVKAISVQGGAAQVMEQACIACGHCVGTCPAGAKRVRDDLPQMADLLNGPLPVYASLAPSWIADFAGITAEQMIAALKRLGFAGVSETALGAQEVSAHVANLVTEHEGDKPWISSACPAAAAWALSEPEWADRVTPLASPLLAHAGMLRQKYGDIRVVFIGPCLAKKMESDLYPELIDTVVTFADIRQTFEEAGIKPEELDGTTHAFVPERATDGALYPVEGGMLAGIRDSHGVAEGGMAAVAGMDRIMEAFAEPEALTDVKFVEVLACSGGCVRGPAGSAGSSLARRQRILTTAPPATVPVPRAPVFDITVQWPQMVIADNLDENADLTEALAQVGKYAQEDELNCGGCGYDSCRAMAAAMIDGRAEPAQCVGHMRRLAQSKATALLQAMPSAAVLVDSGLEVVDANPALDRLLTDGEGKVPRIGPVDRLLPPLAPMMRHILGGGDRVDDRDIKWGDRTLAVTVFPIEPGVLAAAILRDITEPTVQRDEIVRRSRLVLEKQLATVQEIACLLGENAAESEVLLTSIMDAFDPSATDGAVEPGRSRPSGR